MIKSFNKNIIDVKTNGLAVKTVKSYGQTIWESRPKEWGGLIFEALANGTIGMTHSGTNATTTKPSISYSKNGSAWVDWDYTPISVVTGDKVYFNGVNSKISSSSSNYSTFTMTGSISASGNIMSLLYGDDYEGQVSLSNTYCFYKLFQGCTGLTTAPELPATTLVSNCYYNMFQGCTGLTSAPELPATTLVSNCYNSMFQGCTGLTTAPELPATTLATSCYRYMFYNCTSLTTAPALPATTLASSCYNSMFQGCTGLTTAPELPVITLAGGCYQSMFSGCTGLTTAPELPATTLVSNCYYNMFQGCTGLTSAPELPATTLASSCYSSMFSGCSKLNYVKADFTTTPSSTYTSNWLLSVAITGTFVANPEATWPSEITRGVSTVPSGWEIQQ